MTDATRTNGPEPKSARDLPPFGPGNLIRCECGHYRLIDDGGCFVSRCLSPYDVRLILATGSIFADQLLPEWRTPGMDQDGDAEGERPVVFGTGHFHHYFAAEDDLDTFNDRVSDLIDEQLQAST